MDVPEEVQVHLENNEAWSDSVSFPNPLPREDLGKNEKRQNLRKESQTVMSDTESPSKRSQSRVKREEKVDKAGGKCQLGQETKGTPRKYKKESHLQGKGRRSGNTDNRAKEAHSKIVGRDSTSKRKAKDDLDSNPEKFARTEKKQIFGETQHAKGKVSFQQRTRGNQLQRKCGNKRECCSNNKNYSELLSLLFNMKEDWETERKERDLREEKLTARIEELERRRDKERRTSE